MLDFFEGRSETLPGPPSDLHDLRLPMLRLPLLTERPEREATDIGRGRGRDESDGGGINGVENDGGAGGINGVENDGGGLGAVTDDANVGTKGDAGGPGGGNDGGIKEGDSGDEAIDELPGCPGIEDNPANGVVNDEVDEVDGAKNGGM